MEHQQQPQNVSRQNFDDWMVPVYAPAAFIPVRGEGSWLWDQAGKDYVDFAGGIAVNALGHAHPEIRKTLLEQADKVWHLGNGYTNEPVLRLAKQLIDATFADKVFFCNSGAEANEAALKLARLYGNKAGGEKNEIIAFKNAFHGRTLFTVTTGGQPKYSEDFAPLPQAITHLPFNDLAAVASQISSRTCAVIVEPIQGEGGIHEYHADFLQQLRALCDERDWLLMLDEIQCGLGRTGKWFAHQWAGIQPDVMSLAKGLGSGVPIGALVAGPRAANVLQPGNHGTTFGGNPLAMRAGVETIRIMEEDGLLQNAATVGAHLQAALRAALGSLSGVKEVRGQGLMIGVELDKPCGALVGRAAEAGLLISVTAESVIRIVPPLILTTAEADEIVARLTPLVQALLAE